MLIKRMITSRAEKPAVEDTKDKAEAMGIEPDTVAASMADVDVIKSEPRTNSWTMMINNTMPSSYFIVWIT